MTNNKAQEQSAQLQVCGLDSGKPCFLHAQLNEFGQIKHQKTFYIRVRTKWKKIVYPQQMTL